MSAGEFSLGLRVYIEDTDAGGIVYYVNYLKFMERARTEFMRTLGYGKGFIFNAELMFVVRDVAVTYFLPARLDDELSVTAEVLEAHGATLRLRQCVSRGNELMAQGEVKIACVDRAGLKPRRIPGEMLEQLRSTQASATQEA